jgi:hypothetical protein
VPAAAAARALGAPLASDMEATADRVLRGAGTGAGGATSGGIHANGSALEEALWEEAV